MKTTRIATRSRRLLADLQTPVGIYLKVRDMSPQSALLESSDYHSSENSYSFIGVEPRASFSVKNGRALMTRPDGSSEYAAIASGDDLRSVLNDYVKSFDVVPREEKSVNGFFGFTAYDTVRYLENIPVADSAADAPPEIHYTLFRFLIAINHLRNEMTVTENLLEGEDSRMNELVSVIDSRNFPTYDFRSEGAVRSTVTDEEYKAMTARGIEHCLRGDVFQIVLSRRFERDFKGDDFKVYRALRSINPSPYLFYFDLGSYRIFGSSPETHVKVEGDTATIDPIAGTFRRTGDDEEDARLARELLADTKENSEHVMLVDLARNDLSRNSTNVRVKSFKEIQFYSHVIHMVSRVCGDISPELNRIALFADTFPAGTLSGAPKVRAMQLINLIEPHSRGIYGGCIGHIGFDGSLNQAIVIRTFVSRNNTLTYQAGAGIVAKSNPESELAEVGNKLGALNKAIELANQMKF